MERKIWTRGEYVNIERPNHYGVYHMTGSSAYRLMQIIQRYEIRAEVGRMFASNGIWFGCSIPKEN